MCTYMRPEMNSWYQFIYQHVIQYTSSHTKNHQTLVLYDLDILYDPIKSWCPIWSCSFCFIFWSNDILYDHVQSWYPIWFKRNMSNWLLHIFSVYISRFDVLELNEGQWCFGPISIVCSLSFFSFSGLGKGHFFDPLF